MASRFTALILGITLLSGCRMTAEAGSGSSAQPDVSDAAGGCVAAPQWLLSRIERALTVRGASLTRAYVVQAGQITVGPPAVRTEAFSDAWFVAALVSGVGPRPELGAWLVQRLDEASAPSILPANATAIRYGVAGAHVQPIRGVGLDAATACVGPVPES